MLYYKIKVIDMDGIVFEERFDSYMIAFYRLEKLRELDIGLRVELIRINKII